jgi:hypothetical protein
VKKTNLLIFLAVGAMIFQFGCDSKLTTTGFLSDYSHLKSESNPALWYVQKGDLHAYHSFIVEPVKVRFHNGAKAIEKRTKGKLTQIEINQLAKYMHAKIVQAIQTSGNKVTHQPGTGVARVRVAITDIEKSTIASLFPQARLAGIGLGGASMEAEVVDSITDQQIAVVIKKQKGSRIPFTNLGPWDAAKQVMNDWAKRFQKNLAG